MIRTGMTISTRLMDSRLLEYVISAEDQDV